MKSWDSCALKWRFYLDYLKEETFHHGWNNSRIVKRYEMFELVIKLFHIYTYNETHPIFRDCIIKPLPVLHNLFPVVDFLSLYIAYINF